MRDDVITIFGLKALLETPLAAGDLPAWSVLGTEISGGQDGKIPVTMAVSVFSVIVLRRLL